MKKYIVTPKVQGKYPSLTFYAMEISGITVREKAKKIKTRRKKILSGFKAMVESINVSDIPQVSAIRELFSEMNIDLKRELTAVEHLSQLVSKGGLPNINSVVDVCNLASLETFLPIGVFDAGAVKGDLILRLSREGESYTPIGGKDSALQKGVLVLSDEKGVISRPLYKDSKRTMINESTENLIVVTAKYGDILEQNIANGFKVASELIVTSSGGQASEYVSFSIDGAIIKSSPIVPQSGTSKMSGANPIKRIRLILDKKNIQFKILDSGTDSLKLEDQVRALNMKYREGMGTLLYKTGDGRFIAVLRRDDRSIDNVRLKQILKVSELEFCNKEDLQKLGFQEGLLSPFLLDERVEIYVTEAVIDMNRIVCGSATASGAIETTKGEMLRFLEGRDYRVVEISFPNPHRQDADNIQIRTVLSGITPSGSALHIGNYFGAVKPQMDLQETVENSFYFVADLHALTTVQDKEILEKNIVNNVLDFIALGLDPEKSAYFRQSDVPEHSQLAVVLANYIPLSFLKRMHAFKDKLEKDASQEAINMGLFNYPILMAADILLYHPDGVPVGDDQRQHVELTRDIAERFNNTYKKDFFVLPEPLIQGGYSARVIGTDGVRKMSKSLDNAIGIFEDEEIIKKQIMGCYTDPNRKKITDPGTVEGNPVFVFHDLINDDKEEVADLKERYRTGKVGDVEVKQCLIEAHKRRFLEAREKRKEIAGDIDLVKDVLRDGARKASRVAEKNLDKVYEIIGIKNTLNLD